MRKLLILLSITFSLCASQASLAAEAVSKLVVFGDSLSDVGNNPWSSLYPTDPKIKDKEVGTPVANIFTPNFTTHKDHRANWLDFLTTHFNGYNNPLKANIGDGVVHPVYFADSMKGLPSNANLDFAVASAITTDGYHDDNGQAPYPHANYCNGPSAGKLHSYDPGYGSCVPGLILQVKQYVKNLQTLHEQAYDAKTGNTPLFILWAGGNDIFDDITALMNSNPSASKLESLLKDPKKFYSTTPAKNVAEAAKLLKNAGVPGNHIVILGLPDFRKVPAAISLIHKLPKKFEQGLMADLLVVVVKGFNEDLNVRSKLLGAHYIDVYDEFNQAVSGKLTGRYNLIDPKLEATPCAYDASAVNNNCIPKGATRGYAFYNSKHPSTNLAQVFAHEFAENMVNW